MSGHSKWSTIKRKKGALDQKRGKLFSSMGREITISARLFGSDIDTNARLRQAIKKAKSINMPNANIDKAIKKGTGELENIVYEEVSYEGYGPNGVAIFIETITDNKNRTVAEVRHVLSKFGGSLGQNGSVAWNFDKTGIVLIEDSNMTEEEALNLIASKSDGAMRDALVMFDRLVTFTNGNLSLKDVSINLNTLDIDTYFKFSELIFSSSIPEILTKYNEIVKMGFDGLSFIDGLAKHFREMLILKYSDSQKISTYSDSIKSKYEEIAKKVEIDEIIGMIDIINDSEINYKKITDERIHVELCLLKLASYKKDNKKKTS